jgi:hypothetical protein
MSRVVSLIVNAIALLVLVVLSIMHPPKNEFWVVVLLAIPPLVAVWHAALGGAKDQSLLGLYLRRKAAEERLKIKELEDRL